MAYSLYQNIGLRLPQESVDRSLNKLFGLQLRIGTTNCFKAKAAETYKETYDALVARLCNGQLIHADETKISVEGKVGFVWVFANMEEVAYVYSETRHGSTPQSLLKDFTGVLVSDFYAAYDGILSSTKVFDSPNQRFERCGSEISLRQGTEKARKEFCRLGETDGRNR